MSLRAEFLKELEPFSKYISADEFSYSLHFSLKFNYLYVASPKVGSSSIKYFLIKNELNGNDLYHDKYDINRRKFSPLINGKQVGKVESFLKSNMFKFCFVRDPYIRVLSCYLDKIVDNPEFTNNFEQKNGGAKLRNLSFEEFVNLISSQKIKDMDPHWRPQYYQTSQECIDFNFIGRLEKYDDDIKFISNQLNLNQSFLTNLNNHKTQAKRKIDTLYSHAIIRKVNLIYNKDFETFGYKKK